MALLGDVQERDQSHLQGPPRRLPDRFRLQPKRKGRQSKRKLTKTVLAKELIDEADRLGLFPRRLTREG